MMSLWRSKNITVIAGIIISIAAVTVFSTDYLILGNPVAYTIYNQYEQRLTDSEKRAIPLNAPFEIVADNDLLGDQITPVLRTKRNGAIFCFLLDEKGVIATTKTSQPSERILNAKTIAKKATLGANIIITPPTKATGTLYHRGSTLQVLFSHKNRFFVETTTPTPFFGWCSAEADLSFNQSKPSYALASIDSSTPNPLSSMVRTMVIRRIEDANRSYRDFFSAFNRSTRLDKTIPQWSYSANDSTELRFNLNSPYKTNKELSESTSILVEELKKIIAGKQLSVLYTNGQITIRALLP